jgi:hypothetical protein
MKNEQQQQQQKASNRRAKRLRAKEQRLTAKRRGRQSSVVPASVAGAIAVEGQNLKRVLFALLDAAGGTVEITRESIVRVTTDRLILRSTPREDGGYMLELVPKIDEPLLDRSGSHEQRRAESSP